MHVLSEKDERHDQLSFDSRSYVSLFTLNDEATVIYLF